MLTPLFFPIPFLSLDFSLLLCVAVFMYAGAFNRDLSTWEVGKVTTMAVSTYTLSPLSPRSGLFFAASCSFLSFIVLHSIHCSFLFQSVFRQRFHTFIVWWPMGSFGFNKFFNTQRPYRLLSRRSIHGIINLNRV